jgi:hypothetical protein
VLGYRLNGLQMRILIIIAIGAFLSGCISDSTPPPAADVYPPLPPSDSLRNLSSVEKAALAKGFASGLKDPASAQFRWIKVRKADLNGHFDYCAMVNAKNGYGGYIGFYPFVGTINMQSGRAVSGELLDLQDSQFPHGKAD